MINGYVERDLAVISNLCTVNEMLDIISNKCYIKNIYPGLAEIFYLTKQNLDKIILSKLSQKYFS